MDSTDLEREKGITILAKNTAVRLGDMKINIVDTPGHADFGGEVERGADDGRRRAAARRRARGAAAADAVRAAQGARAAAAGRARRQQGRPAGRAARGGRNEVYELFLDLDATRRRSSSRSSTRTRAPGTPGSTPDELGRRPAAAVRHAARDDPARRRYDPEPSAAGARHEPRREPVRRPARAAARSTTARCARAQQIAWCRADGTIENARVTELYITEALDRVPADEAGPGEIVALAGLPDVTIGETIADPDDPRPLPGDDGRRAEPLGHDRHQHERRSRAPRATSSPRARSRSGSTRSSSATSRCASSRRRGRTRGRCRAAASCSSRCSSS